jgi:hypothetical protein
MIACPELEDLAVNYLEGSLPRPKRQELGMHIGECGRCREFLAAYRGTVWVARQALGMSSDPQQAPERLVRAILGSLGR